MLSLLNDFEPKLVLHAAILGFGLATFFALVLVSRCPNCNWLEWVSERLNADDTE